MSVLAFREVLPRTFTHRFGESPTAERKFVVTTTEPVAHQLLLNTVGIFHGASHPDPQFTYLRCTEGSVTETDRQHAEITYRYEVPNVGTADYQPNPLARRDVWSFSVSSAAVPALYYYHGTGNGDIRPLVNAAGDYIEGLQAVEGEIKATITGNRPTFPLSVAGSVTNSINSAPYLGGAAYTWLCQGISAQQQLEVVNDVEVKYWSVSVELVYRSSTWVMKIPHVGWHYVTGGSKTKCWVYQGEGSEKEQVDASAPQALTEAGDMKYPGVGGNPDQLLRRVHQAIDFTGFFGTPPF
jgi:hypothetical protein